MRVNPKCSLSCNQIPQNSYGNEDPAHEKHKKAVIPCNRKTTSNNCWDGIIRGENKAEHQNTTQETKWDWKKNYSRVRSQLGPPVLIAKAKGKIDLNSSKYSC